VVFSYIAEAIFFLRSGENNFAAKVKSICRYFQEKKIALIFLGCAAAGAFRQ